jgi:hypothetical protein
VATAAQTDPATASANDNFPPPPPADPDWYSKLTPEDKVAYRQARLTYATAFNSFTSAKADADRAMAKPQQDFDQAKAAFDTATNAKKAAVATANTALKSLTDAAGALDPGKINTSDDAKGQIAQLQAGVDGFQTAANAVAARQADIDAALAALIAKSDPQPGAFDPSKAKPSSAALEIAQDQHDLDVAKARIPLEAAWDQFQIKLTELKGHIPGEINPNPSKG